MLRLDCLLVNTEVANTVKQIIGYLGHKGLADDTDVSFRSMYKTLRKNGVEIDLETAARIYANELPIHDSRFTPEKDLKYDTGSWFDDVVRAITLQKPKISEKQIGELSPSQAVVKSIADAFANNVKGDMSTKTILKTLEDLYKNAGKRMLGELPNDTTSKETRTAAEIVQQALDNEQIGYRDTTTGTIRGLAKMHEDVRKQIKELTAKMEQTGDIDKVEEWNNYAKSLEDASYTMMFTSQEAKKVLHDSLKDGGFVKIGKNGKDLIDWQKLAGNINSYEQLRTNVIDSLARNGIAEDDAKRVADSMTKEFRAIRGKIIETSDVKQQRLADSWSTADQKVKETLPEIVAKRISEWRKHTEIEGREDTPLKFQKIEAQRIIGDALKNSDAYGMDYAAQGRAIDWQKMAQDPPDADKLTRMVWDRLEEQGLSGARASDAAEALIRDYHQILTDKIQENAKRLLDNRQANLDREAPARKSDLMRLGELHDQGIFDGAHDRLLSHVLGIDPQDVQAIQGIKVYAEKLSRLRQLLSGNDFIVPSITHSLNREIHQILAPLISNKTKFMSAVSSINKIYQVENSLLIATHGNILENHLSGAMELLTTNLNMRMKLGKEAGSQAQDRKLMMDVYRHVAAGGTEIGLAPHQVGGMKERLSDKYTIHNMRGANWKNPKTWAQGLATGVLAIPRTFLSGMDGAAKIGLMNGHMKGAVVDAMVAASGGDMTHKEAIQQYNDAIYGDGQLEIAKQKARQLYKDIGLNYVSEKELNITANELLRENIIQNKMLTAEELKDVMDNSFKQAGMGMGHESNNFMSTFQQAGKRYFNRKEQEAIANNDYNKAAGIRLGNTFVNDMVFRFVASRYNWAWIRAEQAGAGLITGITHKLITDRKYSSVDILDAEKMNEAAVEYQKARQKIFRGAVGLGINATAYMASKALAKALYPNEKDPTEKMFDDLKENWAAKNLFLKISPLWMLQSYEYNQIKRGDKFDKTVGALGNDMINLTTIGDSHDMATRFGSAVHKLSKAKTDNEIQKGYAELGQTFNNFIPHIPLLKQGKNVTQFVKWTAGGKPSPMPPYPSNFWQGFLYGGIIQDALGTVPKDQLPESFKDWGKEGPAPAQTWDY